MMDLESSHKWSSSILMLIRILVVTLEGLEVPFPAAADCELLVSCR